MGAGSLELFMLRACLCCLLCLLGVDAIAGAWTLERGESQAFLTSSFTYGDHSFDDNGDLVEVPEYRKFALTARIERGIRPWLTGILQGEVREETQEELDPMLRPSTSQSFGAAAGGVRLRLYEAPNWVFSTELIAYSGGFSSAGSLAPSDGAALEARALFGVGRRFLDRSAFVDAQAAYRLRLEDDDADEIVVDLTLGAEVMPRTLVLAQSFSTFELGEDVQFHKASASVVRRVTDRLQVELGGSATVFGRNALREFGGRLGLWYTFGRERIPPGYYRRPRPR